MGIGMGSGYTGLDRLAIPVVVWEDEYLRRTLCLDG